jgi:hypothetical protein
LNRLIDCIAILEFRGHSSLREQDIARVNGAWVERIVIMDKNRLFTREDMVGVAVRLPSLR